MTSPSLEHLEHLEHDVLLRIATHRRANKSRGTLSVAVVVTASALIVGLGVGIASAHHDRSPVPSEAVVLGDDASLTPSTLLARGL